MIDLQAYLWTGLLLLGVAVALWLESLRRNDVSIVDAFWSLMFLFAAVGYAAQIEAPGSRGWLVLGLTLAWALRLAIHIARRNHGQPEDYRYQEIRANNEPGFRFKSLYIVFVFQAWLAWIICLPLLAAISSGTRLEVLDYLGALVWLTGFLFEWVGDHQLSRFRADPANRGRVLDSGLWGLTRHPNYFGNFLIWWGFWIIALPSGAWWTIVSPLLMSFLLLRVSGVALLEKDIVGRRPGYAEYIRNTNAFFPRLRAARYSQTARPSI